MKRKTQRPKRLNMLSLQRALTRRAYAKQGGRCYHCSEAISLRQTTADHLIPRYAGGMTKAGNIVASCAKCNNLRNSSETNRYGGRLDRTIGDPTPRSPFEVLKVLQANPE